MLLSVKHSVRDFLHILSYWRQNRKMCACFKVLPLHRFIHVTLNKAVEKNTQRLTNLALVTKLGSSARIQPEVFSFRCGFFSIIIPVSVENTYLEIKRTQKYSLLKTNFTIWLLTNVMKKTNSYRNLAWKAGMRDSEGKNSKQQQGSNAGPQHSFLWLWGPQSLLGLNLLWAGKCYNLHVHRGTAEKLFSFDSWWLKDKALSPLSPSPSTSLKRKLYISFLLSRWDGKDPWEPLWAHWIHTTERSDLWKNGADANTIPLSLLPFLFSTFLSL